jgi:glycosyltransferase involved in cell wall biosynthesis
MKISYAITVCNELEELTSLLNFLQLNIHTEDEVVIQYDSDGVTDEVKEYLNIMEKMHQYTVVGFPLNKDFASFKNNLSKHCKGDYIFQIDADEKPHEYLVDVLHQVLESNPIDLMLVPRINTVEGLTDGHIKKWGWKVNENGWVNFPDFQARIYKNSKDISWRNKVHETLVGFKDFSNFPLEEQWCLYHPKEIDRQEKQNEFYETL